MDYLPFDDVPCEQAAVALRLKEWVERNGIDCCHSMVKRQGGLRQYLLMVTSPKHARKHKREAAWCRDNMDVAMQMVAGVLGLY